MAKAGGSSKNWSLENDGLSFRGVCADCEVYLADKTKGNSPKQREVQADLTICDPPANLNVKYKNYNDNKTYGGYIAFTRAWLDQVIAATRPGGSIWIFAQEKFVSEIDIEAKARMLYPRRKVEWIYNFGQNEEGNFTNMVTYLLYYTKRVKGKATGFTFNNDDPENRIRSYRQDSKDKRAKSNGKMPGNAWVLQMPKRDEIGNVLFVPRVPGNSKERRSYVEDDGTKEYFCNQIPKEILDRIIRTCSNPGDLVLDPFAGSFTTASSCVRNGRNFLGVELAGEYVHAGYEYTKQEIEQCQIEKKSPKARRKKLLKAFKG